jgi:hypothetical protein
MGVLMNMEKRKSPWRWLLLIPGKIILDIIVFCAAVAIDTHVVPDPNALGHPAPAFTLIAFFVLPVLTVIVIIVSIILVAVSGSNKNK